MSSKYLNIHIFTYQSRKEEYEEEDKCFKTFQKKMRLSPAQCIRVGGSPIWMKEEKKINQKGILISI